MIRRGVLAALAVFLLAAAPATASSVRGGIAAIACPSTSLCLAANTSGDLLWSTDPGGGPAMWHYFQLDTTPDGNGDNINSISCPSTTLCVAVDGEGHVLTSTNPTGGAAAWSIGPSTHAFLESVSCSSVNLCAADALPWVGGQPSILTTSDPASGASSWVGADPTEPGGYVSAFDSISCPSDSECVAAEPGEVAVSSNPTGGSGAWSFVTGLDTNIVNDYVSCPSTSLCVMVGTHVFTSNDPGSAASWVSATSPRGDLTALTCPSTSLCVAAGSEGIVVSRNPTAGASAWATNITLPDVFGSAGAVSAIGCAGPDFCLAGDVNGVMWTSSNPAAGSRAWTEFRPGSPGAGYATEMGQPRVRGFTVIMRFRAIGLPGALASAKAYMVANPSHGHKAIVVGLAKITFTAPHVRSLTLRLNAKGHALLRARHRLTVELVIGPAAYEITWTPTGHATLITG